MLFEIGEEGKCCAGNLVDIVGKWKYPALA
jgi:hypothetical protein